MDRNAEAKIIYPICSSNIYVISKDLDTQLLESDTLHSFSEDFPNHKLSTALVSGR